MTTVRERRALLLLGAGAALDFGAPSTPRLTELVGERISTDGDMQLCGGDQAYLEISRTLTNYYKDGDRAAHFERIYHCAHELLANFDFTPGAENDFLPVLFPFMERKIHFNNIALKELVRRMASFIYAELSSACKSPTNSIFPLSNFLEKLRQDHLIRIYTTNYDDFLWQAADDLCTGFHNVPGRGFKSFDPEQFWQSADTDCLCYLHGSVHLGYVIWPPAGPDMKALYWFDDLDEASRHSAWTGSGNQRMDGNEVVPAPIITGLNKLSRLQSAPFSHYYASMARDALAADIVYVIGSGLADLHLNTWLSDARSKKAIPPLVFVDHWGKGFVNETAFERDGKTDAMFRSLRMPVGDPYAWDDWGNGWTIDKERTCAVWDKGFLPFLNAPATLDNILAEFS